MPNDEDLAQLRQGVAAWNDWRAQNPEHYVDLRRADLKDTKLPGANLSWVDLRGADLRGANLSPASLTGADLSRADLQEANLGGATLLNAQLVKANLREPKLLVIDFGGAALDGVDFYGADLSFFAARSKNYTIKFQQSESAGCGSYNLCLG